MTDQRSPEINPNHEKREVLELIKRMDVLSEQIFDFPNIFERNEHGFELLDDNTRINRVPINMETVTTKMKIDGDPAGLEFFALEQHFRDFAKDYWDNNFTDEFCQGLRYSVQIWDASLADEPNERADSITGQYLLSNTGEMVKINWVRKEAEKSRKIVSRDEGLEGKEVLGTVGPIQFEAVGMAVHILGEKLKSASAQAES